MLDTPTAAVCVSGNAILDIFAYCTIYHGNQLGSRELPVSPLYDKDVL